MRPAREAKRDRPDAKLLYVDREGSIQHHRRVDLPSLFQAGDVVVANDAATLPASLVGIHVPSNSFIEVRLAQRQSLASDDVQRFTAVLFGDGDHRVRTEDRALPPVIHSGDRLQLGLLTALVTRLLDHPRFVEIEFQQRASEVWGALAASGRPIQYAYVPAPLALWDTWTAIAAYPAAFEAPSAGFALDWQTLRSLHQRKITFVTLTHAAGVSSTGSAELDRQLPLDEPYRIPQSTAVAIQHALQTRQRIIAIGTTTVRALEHRFAERGRVETGEGLATQRIDGNTRLHVVDAIVSGTHELGESHYELLRAFADDDLLARMSAELEACGYLNHEFGDSLLIERGSGKPGKQRQKILPPRRAVRTATAG